MSLELELLEEYELLGEKRWRFLVKGTQIVINVAAGSREEAERKALELAKSVGIDKLVKLMRQPGA